MKKNIEDFKVQGKYFDNAIPKDLVHFGMIPEYVGRFPVIVSTKGLNEKSLVDILTLPKNSLIKQYTFQFAMNGIKFHATECALKEVAKMAFVRGSGARGLRSITENILMETMFVVSRELSLLFLVHLDVHKLTLIASLAAVSYWRTVWYIWDEFLGQTSTTSAWYVWGDCSIFSSFSFMLQRFLTRYLNIYSCRCAHVISLALLTAGGCVSSINAPVSQCITS